MRLDKFLAEAGIGAKKITRNHVKDGKVTVNGVIIANPATEICEITDEIRYLDQVVIHTGRVYYMFHKPDGCITARQDDECKTVLDYFDKEHRNGLFPVGRLDKDTEGLLLLTNDGEFNHRLMYPDMHVEKTYYFWAIGALSDIDQERLRVGISIGEDELPAKAIRIVVEKQGNVQEFQDELKIYNRKDIRINPYHQPVVGGYITISEGRKHQVKRMLKAVGCYVVYLKRIQIGGLRLDETLEKGNYRELTEMEIMSLFQS